ncbi:hypothetical protein D8I24_5981 [Cupriavidus necator H850]|nr:hypothetical protein D8I24_5981 [Cupriavidus necator H850]
MDTPIIRCLSAKRQNAAISCALARLAQCNMPARVGFPALPRHAHCWNSSCLKCPAGNFVAL